MYESRVMTDATVKLVQLVDVMKTETMTATAGEIVPEDEKKVWGLRAR